MIYDCMIFNDEVKMLKLHLGCLYYAVDKFIITEGLYTFSGRKKDGYNFEKNIEEFTPWLNKIEFHPFDKEPSSNRWENEKELRNNLSVGLRNARPDDVILISDVDEIADQNIIKSYENSIEYPMVFDTHTFYYYLNFIFDQPEPTTSKCLVVTRHKILGSIQKAREARLSLPSYKSGWHFSYMGGVDRIIQKLSDFSHAEYDNNFYKDPERIKEKLKNMEDLFDRKNIKLRKIPITPDLYPTYLIFHLEEYKDWIYDE